MSDRELLSKYKYSSIHTEILVALWQATSLNKQGLLQVLIDCVCELIRVRIAKNTHPEIYIESHTCTYMQGKKKTPETLHMCNALMQLTAHNYLCDCYSIIATLC